jgi:hypothetical protein
MIKTLCEADAAGVIDGEDYLSLRRIEQSRSTQSFIANIATACRFFGEALLAAQTTSSLRLNLGRAASVGGARRR